MNTVNEEWRPVDGYENLYAVSSLGRVKSLNYNHTGEERILKPAKTKKGYLAVNIYRNGQRKMLKVHRLVAEAFLPNPEGFEQVNHIDEVKTNNCVSNIEWSDAKYNANYGSRNKKIAASMTNHPAKSKAVEASRFSDFREICLRFASAMEADRNGYHFSDVSACCRGCYCSRGNFYKNLYWRFAS